LLNFVTLFPLKAQKSWTKSSTWNGTGMAKTKSG